MRAQSAQDVDDNGWPKAPIEPEEPLTEETLQEHERKRLAVLEAHRHVDMTEVALVMDPRPSLEPVPLKSHMSQEEFDELGYPKVPAEWTEEWMAKQVEAEKVDPRVNPNLLIDETQQEFWNAAARKPYAKAVLQSEQHWTDRRNVWLRQLEAVERLNQSREEAAGLLEGCSMEVKRLVTPIMCYRITEVALANYMREAEAYRIPFTELMDQPEKIHQLRGMRQKIDSGGADAAALMLADYAEKAVMCMRSNKKKLDDANRWNRKVSDNDQLAKRLNMAQKCKKDGYIEWHNGKIEDALACWRQADSYLKEYKAPDHDRIANKMIADMHKAVLKNVAQAAIRTGSWTEALDAADDALRIDSQDHKAWFRKACALEGLGRYDEESAALDRVDECAVGRADRERIMRDTGAKRESLQATLGRDREQSKRALARALARGVFGAGREGAALAREPAGRPAPFREGDVVMVMAPFADLEKGQRGTVVEADEDGDARVRFHGSGEVDLLMGEDLVNLVRVGPAEGSATGSACGAARGEVQDLDRDRRKRVTKDSAAELLDDLQRAYADTGYQAQLRKLARDVRWNEIDFMARVRHVALNVQAPVLEKWGFEPSFSGLAEMDLAVEDHLCPELSEKLDVASRLLYGEMYQALSQK